MNVSQFKSIKFLKPLTYIKKEVKYLHINYNFFFCIKYIRLPSISVNSVQLTFNWIPSPIRKNLFGQVGVKKASRTRDD